MTWKDMRKELRISLYLFTLFNIIRFISDEIGKEIWWLHFCLGAICGMAFLQMIIGILPEAAYVKLRSLKAR